MKEICRYCGTSLKYDVADLGLMPLSNDFISSKKIREGQYNLPLKIKVCHNCKLVQVVEYQMPENIFNDEYPYFSSYSSTWLKHCENYVGMIVDKLKLNKESKVIEIASNDGYLLQYFKKYGISPTGIEPSGSVARVSAEKGIHTIQEFFCEEFAKKLYKEGKTADLVIGNNVLAHVPNIDDFVKGLKIILKDTGTITLEFPHLLNMMRMNQFDTIYHEHFSYLSLISLKRIFNDNMLEIVNVEKLETHGGSLRVYITHLVPGIEIDVKVTEVINEEMQYGLDQMEVYQGFYKKIQDIKMNVLSKLIEIKKSGKTVVGYGAAAKGNTLFNYCGVGREFIDYIVDANPHKQNMYLPGSLIPVVDVDYIKRIKPDYVVVIPWNIKDEIMQQLQYIKKWGGVFIVFIPEIEEF